MTRLLDSWLEGLRNYTEETESPRDFWIWTGLSVLASALQRKTWLFFGAERLYPNLYILLVAPPAVSRKAAPLGFANRILGEKGIDISLAADSSSKRRFTSQLAKTGATEQFYLGDKLVTQCATSIVSSEFSDLFAVNLKEMLECLTSVYDSQDIWKYETEGKGQDKLYNLCVNIEAATTPGWIMDNLPQWAIGGGFTSRFVLVYADKVYKRVTIPWLRGVNDLQNQELLKQQAELYSMLKSDLMHIHGLAGEFKWAHDAFEFFDAWYKGTDERLRVVTDERLHPFVGRMHTIVLKVAMSLRVGVSDELVITMSEIQAATMLLERVLGTASNAFGGHGRSKQGPDVQRIIEQLRTLKSMSFRELMKLNYRHLTKTELQMVLSTIESMGLIRMNLSAEESDGRFLWLGK